MAGTHVDGVNDGVGYGVKGVNTTPASLGHFHEAGVVGTSQGGVGVFGTSGDIASLGVFGSADIGVQGASPDGIGVAGHSRTGRGVVGDSNASDGVRGVSSSGTGVQGIGITGVKGIGGTSGVFGESSGGDGVTGLCKSNAHAGVSATNDSGGFGVWARGTPGGHFESNGGDAVIGVSTAIAHAGVSAVNEGGGYGVYASSSGYGVWASGAPAGYFQGDVEVTGNVTVNGDVQLRLQNQDCAEDFEMLAAEEIGPGSVVVIDSVGALKQSDKAYDKRVAGVISGAGDCRPGIILGRQQVRDNRMPVALLGKVYCKVDASHEPIEVGDLLTTSPIPGHAMRVADPLKAFGAVIGKALSSLKAGQGLIPVLVALQ